MQLVQQQDDCHWMLAQGKYTHEVGRRLMKRMKMGVGWRNHLRPQQSHDWWEEGLPAAWGGGGAGCRMAPRSSSPPRELESDAQTASPARAPTPGETRHSHTAPYTLREKTKRYTHTHTQLHTLRGAYGTHSFVRITRQRFRTPSNTCLNQKDKRKHSHRILHPNLTSTQLPNSYRVSACLYKRYYSIKGCKIVGL